MARERRRDQERYEKELEENKKNAEARANSEKEMQEMHQKMKEIRRDIDEANEIAKYMNRDILFTLTIVSPLTDFNIQPDIVQVKVEDFDSNACHEWTTEKF